MDIEERIKELEVERDKLLAETPFEQITPKRSNHQNIKTIYNRKISNLKNFGVEDKRLVQKREKEDKELEQLPIDIQNRIKELKVERDKLLAETPLEIIAEKSSGKGRTRNFTNYTSIKTSYNRKIAFLKKYGVEDFCTLPEYKEKQRQNMVNKWQEPEFRERTSAAITKAYKGTAYKNKIGEIRKRVWERDGFKEKMSAIFSSEEFNSKRRNTWLNKYGTDTPLQRDEVVQKVINSTNRISKINIEWQNYIKEQTGLDFEFEKDNFDLVYDKIAIDINPTFSHNVDYSYQFVTGKTKDNIPIPVNYHKNKLKKAQNLGYHLISIFDWDDEEKIIQMIKPKENKYARQLEIKEAPLDECNNFLEKYHLQGTCRNQTIRLGLYENENLIELMTFGKPRYNKKYQYELLRLCSHCDYKVVGGAEKLFKYFIEKYNPESIISYCDNSKFTGNVYLKLGFTLKKESQPSCHWYNIKTGRHITNNLLNQRGFSQLHNDKEYKVSKKGESNKELMLKAGYVEVYDCGQSTYEWIKQNIN